MDNSLPDCNVCQNADYNGANHSNRRTNNHALLETRTLEIFKKPNEAKCLFFTAAVVVVRAVCIILQSYI